MVISGLYHTALVHTVYASSHTLPHAHARLASGCWLGFTGRASNPLNSNKWFPSNTKTSPITRLTLTLRSLTKKPSALCKSLHSDPERTFSPFCHMSVVPASSDVRFACSSPLRWVTNPELGAGAIMRVTIFNHSLRKTKKPHIGQRCDKNAGSTARCPRRQAHRSRAKKRQRMPSPC